MRLRRTTTGKPRSGLLAAGLLATLVGAVVPPLEASPQSVSLVSREGPTSTTFAGSSVEDCDGECRENLQRARDATEKYWDVNAALTDGFVEFAGCRTSDEGAEGVKYANLERSSDQDLDVEQPEALLYMPEGFGGPEREGAGRRLAGVVYRVPVLDHTQEPPELFGRSFDGPVPGSIAGLPEYRLVVWLFSPNPGGLFSASNPTEACVGAGLVAPHAFEEGLHEVAGAFSVSAAKVREVLGVPSELRLQGEGADGSGTAQLVVSARSLRWSSGDRLTEPTLLAASWVTLQPPDWAGEATNPAHNTDYLFSTLSDNTELVDWMQRGMGVGAEVIDHSDDILLDFAPALGATGPYRFSSPNFVAEGFVTDAVHANTTFSVRAWHDSPHGMGLFRVWHDDAQLGAADITVTPAPGTPLAELLGCEAGSDACDPVRPDVGVAVFADGRSPWIVDMLPEWWNPRLQTIANGTLEFPQGT